MGGEVDCKRRYAKRWRAVLRVVHQRGEDPDGCDKDIGDHMDHALGQFLGGPQRGDPGGGGDGGVLLRQEIERGGNHGEAAVRSGLLP